MAGSLLQQPASVAKKKLTEFARDENLVPKFSENTDQTWYRGDISSTKWNQQFPYQLRILVAEGSGRYSLAPEKGSVFTLPIPPEALTVTMPFAIQTSVTMGGTIEEHNGAPTRIIQIQGTTGVTFGRDAGQAAPAISLAEAVFAGTVTAFDTTKSALAQLTGDSPTTNLIPESDFDDLSKQGKLTGYYQIRTLYEFLETYAELKKTGPQGRKYRLAFCMWKDEAVYLVSPMGQFEIRRSKESPLEYLYSLTLKATKRISLENSTPDPLQAYTPVQRDSNKLAQLLNTVQAAREVLQGARQTLQAVSSDLHTSVTGTLREMALLAKDALSVPLALSDLPDAITKECSGAVVELRGSSQRVSSLTAPGNETAQTRTFNRRLGQLATENVTNTPKRLTPLDPHPANDAFQNPQDSYNILSGIQLGDLNLPPTTVSQIAAERERVRNLTRLDYEERRDDLVKAIAAYSRVLGLSDPTYDKIYGVESTNIAVAVDEPTDDDFEVLFALNDTLIELNRLAVTTTNEPQQKVDAIASMAGLAEKSGIAFRVPRSKYAVPFPYGSTLEALASRYLGDPNRWMEIAALNGLQAPYVDEEGIDLPLLMNGSGNSVVVGDVSQLFVGQPAWISSLAAMRTKRRIRKIEKLVPGQWLVTMDGDPDLQQFGVLAGATLHVFTPNTVNSQQTIYIPSDSEPRDQNDFKTKAIAGVDQANALVAVGGISLLLTPTNDLVVTPNGGTRWAVGLTNLMQQIRLAFSVRKGTLLQHIGYGIPIEPGSSIADVEPADIVRSLQAMFQGNPTYRGIQAAQVRIQGPVARIGVAVEVRGVDQVIPVSVEIQQ